jgi:uncharacterized protein with FMN-binding domain
LSVGVFLPRAVLAAALAAGAWGLAAAAGGTVRAAPPPPPSTRPTMAPRPIMTPKPAAPAGVAARTRAEVEALIQKAGAAPPDWWDSVALNSPPGLDLVWTQPTKGAPWDPQKQLGQYLWSVVNENPGKWREGAKLLHHCLTVNRNDKAKLAKTMDSLGRIYHNLLGDWARAAFWWRKAAGLDPDYGDNNAAELAHCYWKLGSREMAVAVLEKFPEDDTRHGSYIKLWAEMGDLDKALAMAEGTARAGYPDIGYLAAGDACRMAGRYKQALDYYQKVAACAQGWNDLKQNKARAQASIDAIRAAEGLDLSKVRDGTYRAGSIAYAGLLEVAVEVRGGKILSVKVLKHQEKQYYTALADTPAQIVQKQGIRGVDAVTSATITSEAIMNATVKALAQGMK